MLQDSAARFASSPALLTESTCRVLLGLHVAVLNPSSRRCLANHSIWPKCNKSRHRFTLPERQLQGRPGRHGPLSLAVVLSANLNCRRLLAFASNYTVDCSLDKRAVTSQALPRLGRSSSTVIKASKGDMIRDCGAQLLPISGLSIQSVRHDRYSVQRLWPITHSHSNLLLTYDG